MYTTSGVPVHHPGLVAQLNHLKWVRDIQVTGTGTMQRGDGPARDGSDDPRTGTDKGALTLTWRTRQPSTHGVHITGRIGGRTVDLAAPAPSYY